MYTGSHHFFLVWVSDGFLTHIKFQDSSSLVRRKFLDKTHKLLKERAIPSRYASAFALAAFDCSKDLQDAVFFCPLYTLFYDILP